MGLNARSLTALVLLFSMATEPCAAGDKRPRTDLLGDPLPTGAIARLGTSRLLHGGPVHTLVYSPNGKWLVSAGADKVIHLWDAETGKKSLSLHGHQGSVRSLAFVPAEKGRPVKVLVSGSLDKTIRFWDLRTGKELAHRINHPGPAMVLAVSPDGKLLASGGSTEAPIMLWKVEDGQEVRRWKAHLGGVTSLAFAPDGKTIASARVAQRQSFPLKADDPKDDYGVALWETDTGRPRHTMTSHTTLAWAVAFSADGKQLASSGIDKAKGRSVILWEPQTGKQLRAVGGQFGFVDARCLALSRDGKTLAAGDFGKIKLFDTNTGAEQRSLPSAILDHVQALAFSPDGLTLASVGEKGRIVLWDLAQRVAKNDAQGHTQPLTSVAVAPDGKTIATTCEDGTAWLWDRATGKPLRQLKQQKIPGVSLVWCAAFSPDSRTIALSHQRDGITFWDVGSGQLQRQITEKNRDRIVSVAFAPQGKWLASESIDQPYTSLWDTTTGELVHTFPRGKQRFMDRGTSVAISPNGRLLAATAKNGLNVWDLDSKKLVYLKANSGQSVTFSPGGFLVATAGSGGVKVFDAATGLELVKFQCQLHHYCWRGIAFSPDGRLLAVADPKCVRLWDLAAHRELPSFAGHAGILTSVAFTPEGAALVSGSEDGTALLWNLEGVLPEMKRADPKQLWQDLHHSDRLRAYTAFCQLRAAPDDALPFLRANLKVPTAAPAERLADLIKKLDSNNFAVRDQATQNLKKCGLSAEKALRQAAKDKPAPEAAKRIDQLLANLDLSAEWQQTRIALQLLEELPVTKTRELLQHLAKGDADARLTLEAQALWQRLRTRGLGPKS